MGSPAAAAQLLAPLAPHSGDSQQVRRLRGDELTDGDSCHAPSRWVCRRASGCCKDTRRRQLQ